MYDATLRRRVVTAYRAGMTQKAVAEEFGVHVQTVRVCLVEAGVAARGRGKNLSDANLVEARRLHAGGMGLRRLARRYGVSHTTLGKRLREFGDTEPEGTDGVVSPVRDVLAENIDVLTHVDDARRERIHRLAEIWSAMQAGDAADGAGADGHGGKVG